jgi:NAD(P)-dependent dehydrogenase (short-subunit alcohol dehydrogenase family)
MLNEKKSAVIITGACGGIGREMCKSFFESGYKVIAIDSREAIPGLESDKFIRMDLTKILNDASAKQDLKNFIYEVLEGSMLKGLVNNAAIQIVRSFEDLTEDDWKLTLDTNLLVPFVLSQLLLEPLAAGSGSILNVSSIHANQTKRFFAAYATSKAALSSMTKLLAIELGNRIRVNAIEPGAIATDMLEKGFKNSPEKRTQLDAMQPMKRIGSPQEVAQLARFLVSEEAQFINGATVQIDGGIRSQLYDPN